MVNPIRAILKRCGAGFTVRQKVLITALVLAYAALPTDLIPDSIPGLGILDDAFAFFCMGRVWASPTLLSRPRVFSPTRRSPVYDGVVEPSGSTPENRA